MIRHSSGTLLGMVALEEAQPPARKIGMGFCSEHSYILFSVFKNAPSVGSFFPLTLDCLPKCWSRLACEEGGVYGDVFLFRELF